MAASRSRPLAASPQEKIRAFMATAPHRVAVLMYPGASSYDATSTAEVFSTANGELRRGFGIAADAYTFEVISSVPGPIVAEMGVKLLPDRSIHDASRGKPWQGIDTLMIGGGCAEPVDAAVRDGALVEWIRQATPHVGRVASLCTGAFLLAEAGALKGAATTHWAHCARLQARYPHLDVKPDNIFVRSGKIYSSAGSTAAMDLALALVEEDFGRKVALDVARRLVMFLKRPGGQSQFSAALLVQAATSDGMSGIPEWILNHLDTDLSVERLAARAAMSPRNFARVFLAQTGMTPAKYVERARVERARLLIEETPLALSRVAAKSGFESDRQMRRGFLRWLKVMPSDYVARFRGGAGASVGGAGPSHAATDRGMADHRVQPWPS